MIRLIHLVVVCAFVAATVYVYKIKYDATAQAERAAKLRAEVKHERDRIATLRAEWSKLDDPVRIQALAQRHLALKPVEPTQFDTPDHLPERPPQVAPPADGDPIAIILENADSEPPTGATSGASAGPSSGAKP
jgi:hypothetical protein